jgi:hypothetical protein
MNITTVLLTAPVTLMIETEFRCISLVTETLASNIGGTETLVGDPPNIMIARKDELSSRFSCGLGFQREVDHGDRLFLHRCLWLLGIVNVEFCVHFFCILSQPRSPSLARACSC